MKRVFLTTLVIAVACSGVALAQNLGVSPGPGGPAIFAPCVLGPDDITQNVDCEIQPLTGISCSNGGTDAGNQYLRRFFLSADHGITSPYNVDAVQFGIEVADSASGACGPGVQLTFNTYSLGIGDSFLYSNMNLLDSVTIDAAGAGGTIVTVPVGGSVDPASDDLVVEVVTCDSSNQGDFGSFFPGANSLGQTQPTYIAADSCGVLDPTDLALLGFPDSHNVFVVEGTEGGVGCAGAFRGAPRIRRRATGINIDFRLDLTHRRGEVNVPIYAELQDMVGNVIAAKELGLYTLGLGETVSVRDMLKAPASLESGQYVLVAKIPRMKNLLEFKRLIAIP